MNRKDIRKAIAVWTANQMNACETAEEQRDFAEEFINAAIGIWMIRYRDEPREVRKEAVQELTNLLKSTMMASAAKLMAHKR